MLRATPGLSTLGADTLTLFANWILVIAFLATGGFLASYISFFNWRKNQAGKALAYFLISLLVVYLNNILGSFLGPDYPFREVVRLVVYIGVAGTSINLLAQLWRNWRGGAESPFSVERKSSSMDDLEKTIPRKNPTTRK